MKLSSGEIAAAVIKSAPNPDRPRLAEDYERQLYDSDRARASCYAAMETVTQRMKELADELAVEPDDEALPIEAEPWDDDSLVSSVEAFRQSTR